MNAILMVRLSEQGHRSNHGAVLPSGVGTTERWNPLSPERHTAFCIGGDVPKGYPNKPRPTPRERFDTKWILCEETGCWVWIGDSYDAGYGRFHVKGMPGGIAHRWGWTLYVGPIPHGMVLDHKCRFRSCVCPDHLRVVTPRQNVLENSLSFTARFAARTSCPKCGGPLLLAPKYQLKGGFRRWCYPCKKKKNKIDQRKLRERRAIK